MDNISIKNNIRKIRKARKLTQEDMAHKLGISLTAYRDIEKGNTSILNSNLLKIASLLDTPTEEIVLGYCPAQAEGRNIREVQAEYSGRINILEKKDRRSGKTCPCTRGKHLQQERNHRHAEEETGGARNLNHSREEAVERRIRSFCCLSEALELEVLSPEWRNLI